jgi:hypothetical protein
MRVKVVTGFVPLKIKHLTHEQYDVYYDKLLDGLDRHELPALMFESFAHLWCQQKHPDWLKLPLAAPRPTDRYETDEANMCSHFVQHNRTTWAMKAMHRHPTVDVWVWLDYGIMKQGAWCGRPLKPIHVHDFMCELQATPKWETIPFPGISGLDLPVSVHGNNWRFCGSTHVWPRRYLPEIDEAYKQELEWFVKEHNCVPLDLAIWPLVEKRHPELPFRWYKAEYDYTQLTEFNRDLALRSGT